MKRLLAIYLSVLVATSTIGHAAPPPEAEFITLGTGGGPLPRAKRSGPANAVVIGNDVYLFDVGPGTVRQLAAAGLASLRVRAVFLSHHHVDHIGDLAPFLGTRWVLKLEGGLPVYGPEGTATLVAKTLESLAVLETVPVTAGTVSVNPPLGKAASGHDLPYAETPQLAYADDKVKIQIVDVAHFHLPGSSRSGQPRALAFRIEAGGRIFTYTGDTGPTERLVQLAKGSDVLISEVLDLESTRSMLARTMRGDAALMGAVMAHMQQDHLTPADVARLAAAAGVKKVVLSHLIPGGDGEADTELYRRGVAEGFSGPVVVAADLQRF